MQIEGSDNNDEQFIDDRGDKNFTIEDLSHDFSKTNITTGSSDPDPESQALGQWSGGAHVPNVDDSTAERPLESDSFDDADDDLGIVAQNIQKTSPLLLSIIIFILFFFNYLVFFNHLFLKVIYT